jgi:hypothetical protein
MPTQTATAARRAHARSAAPRHVRRLSGPLRPLPAPGGRALPHRRGQTSAFARVGRIADHRIVDGLLRSRAWIVVVAVLLGGIVAMQVSLLKLDSGISRAVEASATLERQNADMQDRIARLSSAQRVSQAATRAGMVFPPAGDVGYLRARGARDAQLAARRMSPPSAAAQALMAAGGHAAATGATGASAGTTGIATGATGTTAALTGAATGATGTIAAPTGTSTGATGTTLGAAAAGTTTGTSATTVPAGTTTGTSATTAPVTTAPATTPTTTPAPTPTLPAATTPPGTTAATAPAGQG